MAGGNPFMPPGANPGGPVRQPNLAGSGNIPGGPSAPSGGARDILGGNRVPGPGVRGSGASILAPPPPNQPPAPNGQSVADSVPLSQQGEPFAGVHQSLKQLQNQYKDGMRAQQVLDHLREELDKLMEMGDTVRPEHVIESAGRLVGKGIGATQLAQIMSDMPDQGGEGLASWIRMHDITITTAERGLMRENAMFQHQMGVAAVKSMAASHLEDEARTGVAPMPPAGAQPPIAAAPTAGAASMPSTPMMGGEGEDNAQ